MISASLKMVALLLALVAGGFAMRDAASASQAVPPCHAAAAGYVVAHHASPTPRLPALETLAVSGVSQALHHDGTGRGCPTDGSCCDAFCHAMMNVSVPEASVVDVTFASYVRSDDANQGSPSVRGPERPPRTVAI